MPYDINQCTFSGTIKELREISTKTGTPMISIKLQCWKEQIRVIAFHDLAENTLSSFTTGSRVEVTGKLQTSSWEVQGVKRYGFQIVADEIKDDSVKVNFSNLEEQPPLPQEPNETSERSNEDFSYEGGPF